MGGTVRPKYPIGSILGIIPLWQKGIVGISGPLFFKLIEFFIHTAPSSKFIQFLFTDIGLIRYIAPIQFIKPSSILFKKFAPAGIVFPSEDTKTSTNPLNSSSIPF